MKTRILNIVYKLPDPVLDFLGISTTRKVCRSYDDHYAHYVPPEPDAVVAAVLERNPKTIPEQVEALLFYACARMREYHAKKPWEAGWLEDVSDIENGAILDPTKSSHTLNTVWFWYRQYCITTGRNTFDDLTPNKVYEHMVTLAEQQAERQNAHRRIQDELRSELKAIFDAEVTKLKSTKENNDTLSIEEINNITLNSLLTYLTNHAATAST